MKVIIILALALISANAFGFDLKGIELGKPATTAQIRKATGLSCDVICSGLMQVAGQWIDVSFDRDRGNRVSQISSFFENGSFEAIDAAFTAKYGKPDETRTPMESGFGAHLERIDHIWTQADGATIQLEKYVTAIKCGLMMRSAERAKLEAAKDAKAKKDI
jgi:hypothetical protein